MHIKIIFYKENINCIFSKRRTTFNDVRINLYNTRCVKSVCIRSYSGPYFSVFGLNMERYSVSLRIHSECEKIFLSRKGCGLVSLRDTMSEKSFTITLKLINFQALNISRYFNPDAILKL